MEKIQIISLIGAFFILVPFAAVQFNKIGSHSLFYQVPNLIGSLILAIIAVMEKQYGFILMEGIWAIVSAYGIFKTLIQKTS